MLVCGLCWFTRAHQGGRPIRSSYIDAACVRLGRALLRVPVASQCLHVSEFRQLSVVLSVTLAFFRVVGGKGVVRGVITQPLWHVRFPRGGLEDAFGSSATTAGLLPRCRYVLPPESLFFFDFRGETSKRGQNFSIQSKKNKDIEKKLPDVKKTFNDASGSFSGPKKAFRLRCDASMRT
jgi:hypothetical protein